MANTTVLPRAAKPRIVSQKAWRPRRPWRRSARRAPAGRGWRPARGRSAPAASDRPTASRCGGPDRRRGRSARAPRRRRAASGYSEAIIATSSRDGEVADQLAGLQHRADGAGGHRLGRGQAEQRTPCPRRAAAGRAACRWSSTCRRRSGRAARRSRHGRSRGRRPARHGPDPGGLRNVFSRPERRIPSGRGFIDVVMGPGSPKGTDRGRAAMAPITSDFCQTKPTTTF